MNTAVNIPLITAPPVLIQTTGCMSKSFGITYPVNFTKKLDKYLPWSTDIIKLFMKVQNLSVQFVLFIKIK